MAMKKKVLKFHSITLSNLTNDSLFHLLLLLHLSLIDNIWLFQAATMHYWFNLITQSIHINNDPGMRLVTFTTFWSLHSDWLAPSSITTASLGISSGIFVRESARQYRLCFTDRTKSRTIRAEQYWRCRQCEWIIIIKIRRVKKNHSLSVLF